MEYLIHIGILISFYAIIAVSFNLVLGYTGLVSVTQAAFAGIGGYATAILGTKFGINFFTSMIIGIIISCLFSFLIGWVLSRLKGDYYVLGTLAFNFIIVSIFINWDDLTNGSLGISNIHRPEIFDISFDNNFYFFLLLLSFLIIIYFISRFIANSSFGRVLKAIRGDEKVIQVFGYNTLYYKIAIFMFAAAMASIEGSFYASYITYIDPSGYVVLESVFILAIVILGGLANLKGSLLGAVFLVIVPEFLRFVGFPQEIAAQMRQLVYGLIIVILMLYRPQGLMGEYKL